MRPSPGGDEPGGGLASGPPRGPFGDLRGPGGVVWADSPPVLIRLGAPHGASQIHRSRHISCRESPLSLRVNTQPLLFLLSGWPCVTKWIPPARQPTWEPLPLDVSQSSVPPHGEARWRSECPGPSPPPTVPGSLLPAERLPWPYRIPSSPKQKAFPPAVIEPSTCSLLHKNFQPIANNTF